MKKINRWAIYELLKNNVEMNYEIISAIQAMDCEEMKVGVIEYLLARSRQTVKHPNKLI